jgi:hypothetical protein
MATRYGEDVDLWDETVDYLKGLPYGAKLSKWLLGDWLDGCRGNEFSRQEFEMVLSRLKDDYGLDLSDGSLKESIQVVGTSALFDRTQAKKVNEHAGYKYMTKMDELRLRCRG